MIPAVLLAVEEHTVRYGLVFGTLGVSVQILET